jgi:hypothetical protein
VNDLDSLDRANGRDDCVKVRLVVGEDVDVANFRRTLDPDEIDRAEQSAGLADCGCQAGEGAGMILDPDADRCAERG